MCGIIGYTGKMQAADIILCGLKKLEYRGYDSAGVAVSHGNSIGIRKTAGRVDSLEDICASLPLTGTSGIGHTRWATHGEANTVNSHPHTNFSGTIAVVHNGIIENYEEIRLFLKDKGYRFATETDTEVIPHLVDYYYRDCYDFLGAVQCALNMVVGSFAIGIICSDCPGKIIASAHKSSLVVGLGENENYISSDINALADKTDRLYIIDDRELAVVTAEGVTVYDENGEPEDKEIFHNIACAEGISKGAYDHFMLKEIHQQAHILRNLISAYVSMDKNTSFGNLDYNSIKDADKIFIIGCGTAYHAALMGKYVIERYTGIPVEADIASEFRYRNPVLGENTIMIAITQSGETADTLAAMNMAKDRGMLTIAITNTPLSNADRIADFTFLTCAGAEVSVASTKAYTAQLASLYIFALFVAERRRHEDLYELKSALLHLPKDITAILSEADKINDMARRLINAEHLYYIGRGPDFISSLEGALKMKEITYIHAEAYPAGELKHGPIALLDEDVTVIALCCDKELYSKMCANICEVSARGAEVLCISPYDVPVADMVLKLPTVSASVISFTGVIPLQLMAYYVALELGVDVDKPRNLAKSVTVE